jgi:hypothetical protein
LMRCFASRHQSNKDDRKKNRCTDVSKNMYGKAH